MDVCLTVLFKVDVGGDIEHAKEEMMRIIMMMIMRG